MTLFILTFFILSPKPKLKHESLIILHHLAQLKRKNMERKKAIDRISEAFTRMDEDDSGEEE
jgi:hypothetical protein